MYRMAIMTLLMPHDGVDVRRALVVALAHDMAECIVGDITPHDGVPKEEKARLEREAMELLAATLGHDDAAALLVGAWREYEDGTTAEAQAVKDIDKLEMIIQAFEYERDQPLLDLSDFYNSVRGKFRSNTVQHWAQELLARRVLMHAERIAGSRTTSACSDEADAGHHAAASGTRQRPPAPLVTPLMTLSPSMSLVTIVACSAAVATAAFALGLVLGRQQRWK